MFLAENIRFLRRSHGLSQNELAAELGYKSFTTIQKWECGIAEPPLGVLSRMSELFHVDLDDLANTPLGQELPKKETTGGIRIPVLGKVAAGLPIEAVENIIDYEEITAIGKKPEEYFGLQIKGDSMFPRIQEGDVVIVRKQADVDSGDTAIVLVNGEDATCKKIKKNDAGILLLPLNARYEPTFYSNEEITSLPVTIVGKVVELRGKL